MNELAQALAGAQARRAPLFGTNCGNCKFFQRGAQGMPQTNEQGGLLIAPEALSRAQKADLITLPGQQTMQQQGACGHPEVRTQVNDRMCCAYWDNPGALRQWQAQKTT